MPFSTLDRSRIASQLEHHLPPATLLLGLPGSGKRAMAMHVADHHGVYEIDCLEVFDLTVDKSRDIISFASTEPFGPMKVVVIHTDGATFGSFNVLLKTLEEPPLRVKFIMTASNASSVPETIASRCAVYYLHSIGVIDNDVPAVAKSTAAALIRSVVQNEKDLFDRIMHSMKGAGADDIRSSVMKYLIESVTNQSIKDTGSLGALTPEKSKEMIIALGRVSGIRSKLALRTALEPLLDTRYR